MYQMWNTDFANSESLQNFLQRKKRIIFPHALVALTQEKVGHSSI